MDGIRENGRKQYRHVLVIILHKVAMLERNQRKNMTQQLHINKAAINYYL